MSDLNLYGTGRRKRSVARVFLKSGSGKISINGKDYKDYLCRQSLATIVRQPLVALEIENSYDININVKVVDLSGQAGAIRLGIARALNTINEDYRKIIKQKGFLTRDARKVERKKTWSTGCKKEFSILKTLIQYMANLKFDDLLGSGAHFGHVKLGNGTPILVLILFLRKMVYILSILIPQLKQ